MNTNFERLTASEMDPLRGGKWDQKTSSSQGSTKSNGAYDTDQNGDSDPSASIVQDFNKEMIASSNEIFAKQDEKMVEIGTDTAISTLP